MSRTCLRTLFPLFVRPAPSSNQRPPYVIRCTIQMSDSGLTCPVMLHSLYGLHHQLLITPRWLAISPKIVVCLSLRFAKCSHYFESFLSQYPHLLEHYGILSRLYLVRYSRRCMAGRVILKLWTYLHPLQKLSVCNILCRFQ